MAETTREELNEIRSRAALAAYQAANPLAAGLVARATPGHDDPDVVTSAIARGLLGTGSPGAGNFLRGDGTWSAVSAVTDGDKGDISISGGVWTIDNGVVSTAKMGGDVTTAGKNLLDDANAAAQLVTLGAAAASHNHAAADITSGTVATARLGSGSATSSTFLRGDQTWAAPTTTLQTVQIFDSAGSHSYVTPAGARLLIVECVGGGGGGGGVDQAATNSAAGGGGGGGGYARTYITTPASDYDIVVGAHGPGGAPGLNNGSPGEDSIFREDGGGTILCNGKGGSGGGGNQVAAVPHIGGFGARGGGDPAVGANVGDVTGVGSPGDYGVCLAAAQGFSGTGGASVFGGGGQGKAGPTGGGVNAPGVGGGGSGGLIFSGGADQSGGNGAAGIVIVTEIY